MHSVLRTAKNYTKGYSDTQSLVRNATSNDPLPPTGTDLNAIAQMTYNQNDFIEIMEMLDKRLNDKGKNWRHVFKSLSVLDYCLHSGSENVFIYFRDNIYIIKTLKEFQYIDEDGKDVGANVRQKAKDITNLLQNESRLRDQRKNRGKMRERMNGNGSGGGDSGEDVSRQGAKSRPPQPVVTNDDDDEELRRAIEASKKTAAEEKDIQQAFKLSEEAEALRNKAVEDSNAAALFDDLNQQAPPNLFTANSAGLQPQFTQLQPQYTSIQPQFTQVQPQFTAFNPYQQQAQQEAGLAEYQRQQELQWQQLQQQQQQQRQQAEEAMRQQELLQWQQQQQQQQLQAQQQLLAQQQFEQHLQPQPTGFGTNNPFAPPSPAPPLPSFPTNQKPVEFNLGGTFSSNGGTPTRYSPLPPSSSSSSSPAPSSFRPAKRADTEHADLANLFANRDDGQDTFGNIGALRYGNTNAGRGTAQKTGQNPFAQQQQSNEQPFFNI